MAESYAIHQQMMNNHEMDYHNEQEQYHYDASIATSHAASAISELIPASPQNEENMDFHHGDVYPTDESYSIDNPSYADTSITIAAVSQEEETLNHDENAANKTDMMANYNKPKSTRNILSKSMSMKSKKSPLDSNPNQSMPNNDESFFPMGSDPFASNLKNDFESKAATFEPKFDANFETNFDTKLETSNGFDAAPTFDVDFDSVPAVTSNFDVSVKDPDMSFDAGFDRVAGFDEGFDAFPSPAAAKEEARPAISDADKEFGDGFADAFAATTSLNRTETTSSSQGFDAFNAAPDINFDDAFKVDQTKLSESFDFPSNAPPDDGFDSAFASFENPFDSPTMASSSAFTTADPLTSTSDGFASNPFDANFDQVFDSSAPNTNSDAAVFDAAW